MHSEWFYLRAHLCGFQGKKRHQPPLRTLKHNAPCHQDGTALDHMSRYYAIRLLHAQYFMSIFFFFIFLILNLYLCDYMNIMCRYILRDFIQRCTCLVQGEGMAIEEHTYLPGTPPTSPLNYLPNYILTHQPFHLLMYLPTFLPTYQPTQLHTYPPNYLSIYLPTLLTYPITYLPTYLPNYPFTYLPTHLSTYLPT